MAKAAEDRSMNETGNLSPDEMQRTPGERVIEFAVPGMGSDHCAGIVSGSIKRLPGVAAVATSIASHRVTMRFDPAASGSASIKIAVERAGYEVAAVGEAWPSEQDRASEADIEERYLAQAGKRLWIAAVPTVLRRWGRVSVGRRGVPARQGRDPRRRGTDRRTGRVHDFLSTAAEVVRGAIS